jgi:hypothetical protein
MRPASTSRRDFLVRTAAGIGAFAAAPLSAVEAPRRPEYRGPNVILIRFGGGARRRESIDARHTFTPFVCHELAKRGVLYPRMEIDQFRDLQTSHGEGTLHLLTGVFDRYRDVAETRAGVEHRFLGARFEARVPTLFEYLRERRTKKPVCDTCPRAVFCGGFYELDNVPEPTWLVTPEDLVKPVQPDVPLTKLGVGAR